MAITEKTDLRVLLRAYLADVSSRNSKFSLRAFAQKLDISPSHLSRVLNGKKQLSPHMAIRLAREINLPASQIATLKAAPRKLSRSDPNGDKRSKHVYDLEYFRLIADWYHFPILELVRTKGFQADAKWIARRLNLTPSVVDGALERLEDLGLIRRKNGEICLENAEFLKTSDDVRDVAIRKHHEQMMRKAIEALGEQGVDQREFQALNLNFNPSSMPEAKKYIRKFLKDFNAKFSRRSGEEVYQINLQLFSLTKGAK